MDDQIAAYIRTRTFSTGDALAQRVLLRLYRCLAACAPVTPDDLAAAAAVDRETVDHVIRSAEPTWLRYDGSGRRIVAFGGLDIEPTDHRLRVDGRTLYAWCAFDSLFLPEPLDGTAAVSSRCAVTGTVVSLTVAPDGISGLRPAGTVMSFVMPDAAARCADIRGAFCDHVGFLASPSVGEAWLAAHPGGRVVGLGDAVTLARLRNRVVFAAVLP